MGPGSRPLFLSRESLLNIAIYIVRYPDEIRIDNSFMLDLLSPPALATALSERVDLCVRGINPKIKIINCRVTVYGHLSRVPFLPRIRDPTNPSDIAETRRTLSFQIIPTSLHPEDSPRVLSISDDPAAPQTEVGAVGDMTGLDSNCSVELSKTASKTRRAKANQVGTLGSEVFLSRSKYQLRVRG